MSRIRHFFGRAKRVHFKALAVICLTMPVWGAEPVPKLPPATPRDPEQVSGQVEQESTMRHLGQWVAAAQQVFARVRDYQCTLTKRERINGKLLEEQNAQMKVRSEPFSVHIKFVAPRSMAGKEASYVQGRNEGKMRAKNGGALQLVGYVTIDPSDRRAMQGTRHAITEAGIGNLIARLAASLIRTDGAPDAAVKVAEYSVGEHKFVRFELIDARADGKSTFFRTLIYFDKETNLPTRYEAYDTRGDLIESFAHTNLRFNIGLTDASFP